MHGVIGSLTLAFGCGDRWPLFAAATWTHIGTQTVSAMGQLLIRPIVQLWQASPDSAR